MGEATKETKLSETLALADDLFLKGGYNCAASVLQALQKHYGLAGEDLWMVATGLGGGLGRCQDVCGALSGGAMAIGLAVGKSEGLTRESRAKLRDESYARVRKLYGRFDESLGAVDCRTMTGFDFLTPEGHAAFQASDARERVCKRAVHLVIETVAELV